MTLSSENLTNDSTKEKKDIPKWVPVALVRFSIPSPGRYSLTMTMPRPRK